MAKHHCGLGHRHRIFLGSAGKKQATTGVSRWSPVVRLSCADRESLGRGCRRGGVEVVGDEACGPVWPVDDRLLVLIGVVASNKHSCCPNVGGRPASVRALEGWRCLIKTQYAPPVPTSQTNGDATIASLQKPDETLDCHTLKPHDPAPEVYAAIATRRLQWDNMVWQVPVTSLTAQAFLLTIALDDMSSKAARIAASGLAVIAAILAVQLMTRHRQAEITDAHWLWRYEETHHSHHVVHGPAWRQRRNQQDPEVWPIFRWLRRLPGFATWAIGLSLFGLVALATLVSAAFDLGVLP